MDVTPPSAHVAIALQAFEAGLHVLGEKPLSDNYAAARRVVEAGERSGLTHMITQNYRFSEGARTMKHLVADGL